MEKGGNARVFSSVKERCQSECRYNVCIRLILNFVKPHSQDFVMFAREKRVSAVDTMAISNVHTEQDTCVTCVIYLASSLDVITRSQMYDARKGERAPCNQLII